MQRHGFIKEQPDIKHLILFCLSLLPFAVKESDLLEVVFIDDGFGYFEYSSAFQDLVKARHIAVVDAGPEKEYLITPRGKELLDMLERDLRQSVRDRAEAAAIGLVRKIRRNATITTTHVENPDQTYTVTLRISEPDGQTVAAVDMTVFTLRQCSLLEDKFRRNAELVYKKMIEFLLSEPENGGDSANANA